MKANRIMRRYLFYLPVIKVKKWKTFESVPVLKANRKRSTKRCGGTIAPERRLLVYYPTNIIIPYSINMSSCFVVFCSKILRYKKDEVNPLPRIAEGTSSLIAFLLSIILYQT